MDQLVQLLTETEDPYSTSLRVALFGTSDSATIAEILNAFLASTLTPIVDARFVRSGVGLVVGCVLRDGSDVVVKIHRWNVSHDRLVAVQHVQAQLADAGRPAPRPLVPPTAVGAGLATVDELRDGATADGHRPEIRNALAAGLADFVSIARRLEPISGLDRGFLSPPPDGPLWGEPHDLRFDFDRTRAGADWIDELGERARRTLSDTALPDVVAHLDWRVENLAFHGDEITAIYDWDSVGTAPEAVAVGQAAAQFPTDWRIGPSTLPTLDEMREFVRHYERRRGHPFEPEERHVLDAANLMLCAYGARCQHSDRVLHPDLAGPPDSGWERLLRQRGADGMSP